MAKSLRVFSRLAAAAGGAALASAVAFTAPAPVDGVRPVPAACAAIAVGGARPALAARIALGPALAFAAVEGYVAADTYKLDAMHDAPDAYSRQETYELAAAMTRSDPENAEVAWRAARAAYMLATEGEGVPADRKKELILQAAKTLADVKTRLRDNNNVYRWAGTTLSAAGDYKPTAEGIKDAYVIRDDWLQAVALNPYDASAHHLLGRWAHNVATLSWVKRKLAATLFAEPPSATLEEARDAFTRAEQLQPGFWKANQLWLARVEAALGNKAAAADWAASALELPVSTGEDKDAQKEALALLKQLDAARGKAAEEKEKARGAAEAAAREERARASLKPAK